MKHSVLRHHGHTERELIYLADLGNAFSYRNLDREIQIADAVHSGETFKSIGDRFGVTTSRARQIYVNVIRRGKGASSRLNYQIYLGLEPLMILGDQPEQLFRSRPRKSPN